MIKFFIYIYKCVHNFFTQLDISLLMLTFIRAKEPGFRQTILSENCAPPPFTRPSHFPLVTTKISFTPTLHHWNIKILTISKGINLLITAPDIYKEYVQPKFKSKN